MVSILSLVAGMFVMVLLSARRVHAALGLETETEREKWCSFIRDKYGGDKKNAASSSGNIIIFLKGQERSKYLNFCSSTPGSLQDKQLKATIAETEADAIFDHPISDIEKWCVMTRDRYAVEPGQSFGSMPQSMHANYLKAKCHRFFCEPDPRAGNGKFNCVPLTPAKQQEQGQRRRRRRLRVGAFEH